MSDHKFGDDHVRQYIETGGEEGYEWRNGTTILLLTTTGRKSGSPRIMPLIFREVDGKYVIVASKGGYPQHPAWYLNLSEDPEVEVQVKDRVFTAEARDAEGAERTELWDKMVEVWPDYENYQKKTDREIPVVVLDPK
jgi:deazaflavin-dependent oxidoreductase (nitroreductase family)